MENPEKVHNEKQHTGKTGVIMFFIFLAALIIFVLAIYFKNQNIKIKDFSINDFFKKHFQVGSQVASSELLSEFKNDHKDRTDFAVYKNNIVKCTKDSIVWLDKKGNEQKVISISTENPVIKTAGSYILVADIGGKDFYLINGLNVKWSKKADTILINADIDSNGFVSIVKEKKGYKGAIDIFDNNGNMVLTTVRSGNYVLAARIFSNDNRILINKVDTSGITANSNLEFINMRAEEISKSVQEDNTIFPNLWNLNGDYIFGVSDNSLVCYNMKLEKKWKRDFKKVYSSNTALGKYVVLAVQNAENSGKLGKTLQEVLVINSRGEDQASYASNLGALNISCSGNVIAVNYGSEVHFISTGGRLISRYQPKSEILNVFFFNRQEAMLQTQNSIIILKI